MKSFPRLNELLATAYNVHVGPRVGGAAMTPADAAALSRGDKAALCRLLEERGGSDLFTAEDARRAFAAVVS